MKDAGVFLSRTANSGSGTTTIQVIDSRYFHNGFGIKGETGDLIQLEGQTETARVVGVNYGTHTLTLSNSLTWSNDQGISLAYYGNSPDIGAYEVETGKPAKSMISIINLLFW